MITLHHLEKSQSIRILWLLEELGVPYEVKLYDRDPNTRLAPAEYKAVSPLGTAPCITDGEITLSETNAIMDYILDTHDDGRLRPAPGTPNRADYLFWFHVSQGSLQPLLTNKFVMMAMTARAPFFLKPAAKMAGMDAGNYPNAHRFLQQMRAYPSYQRALEKDGKGTILL